MFFFFFDQIHLSAARTLSKNIFIERGNCLGLKIITNKGKNKTFILMSNRKIALTYNVYLLIVK